MKLKIILLVFIIYPINIFAFGSNLFSGYPSNDCIKPTKPMPPISNDDFSINMYNSEVDIYNEQRKKYIECIKNYLDNANNDIQDIKEKMREAIDEANE